MPNSEGKKRPPGQDKTTQKRKRKPEYARVNAAGVESMKGRESTQEEKYRILVQNIPCAVYSAYPGKAGPTTFMSNKWKEWTGYSPEELYHDPESWPGCIHRDDREHTVNTYIEACRDRMAYNLEYRVVHKDTGQIRYVRDQGHLSKDEKGAVVRVDGIVTDITELKGANNELDKYRDSLEELVKKRTSELTSAYETLKVENKERKKADQALRQSEEKYRKLFEGAQDGIVLADAETGIIVDCNRAITEMLDMDKSELLGQHQSIIHPPDRIDDGFSVSFRKHVRQSEEQVLEEQVMTRTGRIRDVAIKAKCVQLSDRKLLQGVFHDITERKQSEETLHETTDLLETIFEHTHMLVACLDPNYNFVRVNRAYADADEYQVSFFPGKNHFDLYPNEENEVIFRRVVETGIPYFAYARPFEYAEHPERGGSYWDWGLVPIKNQQGIVSGLVLTLADVTARKHAEEALKASEGKLSAMLQSIADPMSMMDGDLNIIWANEKAMNIFGDDIVGRKCYEAYHGREKPCEPYPCLSLMALQDGNVHEHDTQVVDKDGKSRYFHCSANVALRDEQGKPAAVLEISKDITNQNLAEQALRESEDSYRAVVENAVEGIVVAQDKLLKFVNPALLSMVGYSKEDLLTRSFIEFVHPDHRDRVMGIHIKRLKGEEVPPVYEFKVIDKKGNVKWLENNGILIEWRDKPATLNFLRDVTERKKAEQAIWASESEKRSILNAISDHIIFHDTDLLIRWGNETAARSIGMTQRELIGRYCYELWQGRSEPCERCPVIRAVETGSHTQAIMTTPDGKCWEIIGEPVLDREGQIRGAIEISRDITERKKAEESLKCRMEFERLLTMLSKRFIDPGGIDGKIIEALKSIGEFAGVDRAYVFQLSDDGRTVDNTHEWCAEGIKPQIKNLKGITLDKELPWFWEKMKANETFHVPAVAELPPEAQLEKKHFEMQDIQALVVVPMLSKGILKGFLGFDSIRSRKTWPDDIITLLRISGESISLALDREHAEQRARFLSSTVEQSSEGMCVVDLQGSILFLNNAFAAMHGYTPGELVGKHMSIFHTPEQMPSVEAANRRTKEMGDFNGEIWHLRRDGTFFTGLMHNSLLRDDEGNPIGLIGTLRDITESKKAEQSLKESEIKFRSITEESLVGVYVIQDGVLKYINPKFAEIFGYSVDELINKKRPDELVHPDDWPASKENLRKRIAGELKSIQYAFRGITKNKEVIHLEVYGSGAEYEGRPAVIGTLRDITEHKQAEKKLLEHQAKLKSLASQLSLTEEHERYRLATDLHDQISQSLVISKIKLDQLRKSSTSDEFDEPLEDVCNCLGQIIDDTRTLTFDLSYPILYELGFEAAVAEWLTDQIQEKHGIRTEFLDDGHQKPLDDDIRVLLFRNVRELLINVVKHAQANKVRVSIRKVKDNIRVSVEDDGVGFDPVEVTSMAAKRAEFGLFSIRERLEQLGGLIEIDSKRRRGSKITMIAPLKNGDEADRE